MHKEDKDLDSNGITIQPIKGEGYKNGKPLELTSNEYKLLCLFMGNPEMVLSPEQILDCLRDHKGNYIDHRMLAVYIRKLRMKIEDDPAKPKRIVTVRGMGYKWKCQ